MFRPRRRWLGLAGCVVVLVAAGSAAPAIGQESTGTIAGHLTDAGAPVAATVFVDGFDTGFFASSQTDGTGAFSIPDIPTENDLVVSFLLDGGFVQYYHQQLDANLAERLTVTDGGTTTVEETLVPHGGLTGHVSNADGSPAVGFQVLAEDMARGFPFVQTQTGADGSYTLPVVPGGDYRVSYRKDFSSPPQYANNHTDFSQADPIHVTNAAVTTEDETMLATGAITGTLTDHGQPVPDASVNATSTDGMSGFTTTGADGSYRMDLFPGTYTVQYQLPGGLFQYARGQIDPNQADPIAVTANVDTIVDEQVAPQGTLSGHLADHDGNPVQGAGVTLINDIQSAFAATDESGNFQFPAYTGTYRLEFGTPFGTQWAGGSTTGGASTPITINADQTTTVNETLAATGSVTVTAKDSLTNAAVQSFCAGINGINDICTTDGTVSFPTVLPGRYGVEIRNPGEDQTYMFQAITGVMVSSGADTPVHAVLNRAASVTSTFVDATTGAPVGNACLELIPLTQPTTLGVGGQICADDGGHVVLDHVGPGSYKAFASVRDGVHGGQWVGSAGGVGAFKDARTVTVTAGAHLALPTIRLDKAGSIAGTVTDAGTGQPLSNAFVGLSSFNVGFGGGGYAVSTDADGRYTLNNLGPYAWTLFFASYANHAAVFSGGVADRDKAIGVKVKAGATKTFNQALGAGTTVTGKVTAADGTQSHNARITFVNADTGEEIGVGDIFRSPFSYTAHVAGAQKVKIRYNGAVNGDEYAGYVGGPDFAHATVFTISGTGSRTMDVIMTNFAP